MKAFNSDHNLKVALLEEIGKHRKADQIEQGHYGKENGHWKGCAVACSLRSLAIIKGEKLVTEYNQHSRYETDLGIPRAIAKLEDRIFENLPKEQAILWPERFTEAINVGADLSLAIPKLMVWLMGDIKQFVKPKYTKVLAAIETVEKLYIRKLAGEEITDKEWNDARVDAYAAAYADADADAAYAAAYAADAAYAYADAYAARKNYWIKISNKLVEILKSLS